MDQTKWTRRYVERWSELTDGKHDPHATWDDAGELYPQHRNEDPDRVADAQFVATVGPG
jgi:hypothetical protein